MNIKINRNSGTAMTTGSGPFYLETKIAFNQQKSQLNSYLHELKNRRVAMLPGGIGRLTHYARTQEIDAWCIDASQICQELCHQYYPTVPFLLQDMSLESSEWDACFLEDNIHTSNPSLILKLATNWQRVCRVYPRQYTYYVLRFNSTQLDEQFDPVEPIGQQYFDKMLSRGEVRSQCSLADFDDYEIETCKIDLNQRIVDIDHLPVDRYTYTAIGLKRWDDSWSIRFWNQGYKQIISTNERHLIGRDIPELV